MKGIFWIVVVGVLSGMTSCETENKKYYAGDFISPRLLEPVSGSKIILTEATAGDTLTLSWTPADFGFPSATTYTVQIAKANTFFESAVKIAETKDTVAHVDYATLNNSLLIAGLAPETPAGIEIRINATINNHIETLRSDPLPVTATAYNVEVTYPILFAPGSYQGWNAGDSSTVLTSPRANDVYEGYLYFTPDTQFKLTGQNDWNPLQWGYGGNGKLRKNGDNIPVGNATAGLYKVVADITNLTYSITPVSWTIAGSATPDTGFPLAYDETGRILTVTADLRAGEFIFREKGAGNRILGIYFRNQLTDNGNQIVVPQAGRYKIVLNLKRYPYTYSLTAEGE